MISLMIKMATQGNAIKNWEWLNSYRTEKKIYGGYDFDFLFYVKETQYVIHIRITNIYYK